ncbi:MAG: zinc ribbon domain-containing protein [Anaerolineae bacterium]
MTKGADLYRLQCLDTERDAKQRRLAEVEAALGESEVLKQARQALESAQAQVKKWALRQRDLELEIQGLADKISRSEKRLYSGVVKNPKELADLQAEVAALRRRRQKLEDDLLEAMIEREEADTTHAQAQEHLDEIQARWSDEQAGLVAEREALRGELAKIEQAQAGLLPSIEAHDLAVYQALRHRKGGQAVVQVHDGACGGCGIAISPSLEWRLRQGELVHCGNCERIVVRVAFLNS